MTDSKSRLLHPGDDDVPDSGKDIEIESFADDAHHPIGGDRTKATYGASVDPENPLALVSEAETGAHKMSTFYGVYLPVIMSVYNVMMYIRFSWMVGCLGLGLTFVVFFLGFFISFVTTMSLSAICANGTVKGGGVYFILSRVLGPTVGGSVGVLTWLMNAISGNLSILGMLSPLMDEFEINITGSEQWDIFLLGTIILASFTFLSAIGNELFEKLSVPLFSFTVFASIVAMAGYFHNDAGVSLDGAYTGLRWETFRDNFVPPDTPPKDKETGTTTSTMFVFGVFYPAVTGILAGASMSGDLKTPDLSIPRGTFGALVTALVTYMGFILLPAASVKREKLVDDYFVTQRLCFSEQLLVFAMVITAFLSALTGMMGCARTLQAIAKDDLTFRKLKYFGEGSDKNNTPRRAIMLTWGLNQLVLLVTEINILAPAITQFFLVVYGMVNLAAVLQRVVGVVNFRPRYLYHHWSLSLAGFVACAVTMFVIDPINAVVALGVFGATAFAIVYRGTDHINWGELSQALLYHRTRKFLLKLNIARSHVKYWRPEILLFTKSRKDSLPLISLGNALKKGGMYSVSSILIGNFEDTIEVCQNHFAIWSQLIHNSDLLKAFPTIVPATSILQGAQTLLLSSGLGAMRPNTILLGWPTSLKAAAMSGTSTTSASSSSSSSSAAVSLSSLASFSSPTKSEVGSPPTTPLGLMTMSSSFSLTRRFRRRDFGIAILDRLQEQDLKTAHGNLSIFEFGRLMHDVLNCGKNIILAKSLESTEFYQTDSLFEKKSQGNKNDSTVIEVWPDAHLNLVTDRTVLARNNALFAIQMAYILHSSRGNRLFRMKVMSLKMGEDECRVHENFLNELLTSIRVRGHVEVINCEKYHWQKSLFEQSWVDRCRSVGEVIMEAGRRTPTSPTKATPTTAASPPPAGMIRFIAIPPPPVYESNLDSNSKLQEEIKKYFRGLLALSNDETPTLYCRGVQEVIAIGL